MKDEALAPEPLAELTEKFQDLVRIMDELREKCPWDQQQTIHTLRSMTIEETYELAGAIDAQNWTEIKEELGDLFLHLLFYARIGRENEAFNLTEVLAGIADKMILRHPHIYGDTVVKDADEVKRNWQKIKMQEGKASVFSGVPTALPAVVKAIRIQEKARQAGFDWDQKEPVFEKVQEELGELQEAVNGGTQDQMEEELGDTLFSLINYARFLKVDAETALEKTNQKFMARFMQMEKLAAASGKTMTGMDLQEMDLYWNQAKKLLQAAKPS